MVKTMLIFNAKLATSRYNYGIIVKSDIPDEAKKKEMLEICQIACEKFAAAEKTPLERDNQAAAEMIKVIRYDRNLLNRKLNIAIKC